MHENDQVIILNIIVLLWSVSRCFLNMSFILIPVLKSKTLPGVCVLIWSNHAWQATFQIVFRDCDEDFSVEYFIGFVMKKARVVIHLSFFPAWDPAWWQQYYCKLNITDVSMSVIKTRWFPNSSSKLSRKGTIIIYFPHLLSQCLNKQI